LFLRGPLRWSFLSGFPGCLACWHAVSSTSVK
jgi:hypothetical protein